MISVVVPTYNEKDNLGDLVKRITAACSGTGIDPEIVIVDDNSPDGTGDYAEELAKTYRMKVVHRTGKLGLSSAVIEGFRISSGSIFVVMDADLSHPPEKIPEMVGKIQSGEAEVVVGSRYVKGGGAENWPFYRKVISKGATLIARGLTKVKDPMSGFFALKKEVLDGAELSPVGYKIGLEILVKGKYSKVVEVPIRFANRKAGSSKLGGMEMLRYIDHVSMLYEHHRFWLGKYLKFAFIGGIGAIINLAVFWVAHEVFFLIPFWAIAIAFVVADTNNYIWNRLWTFRSKSQMKFQYPQFLVVSFIGLALNELLFDVIVYDLLPGLHITVDKASVLLVGVQALCIFIVSVFNFLANSMWTFRHDMKRGRKTQ
jgi:dolichol-phosphate mannosyltransferase